MSDEDGEYIEHRFLKKNTVMRRSYQEKIFASALGKNSMIVLPTSLGKTIVALLMTIFHLDEQIDRKILFIAPTKPLVVQHQKSFREMTTFEEWELPILTGATRPDKREKVFLDAKVAFMTPQVLQNDIISNRVDLKDVSLIIFDEAHRATGDYAYTFIAEVFSNMNPKGQILAMSASPGGTEEKIREVCANLHVDNIEIRTKQSPDVKPYVHQVEIEWIHLQMPDEYMKPKKRMEELLRYFYKKLHKHGFLESYGLNSVNRKNLLVATKKIDRAIRKQRSDDKLPLLFAMKKIVSNAIRVSHMHELLEAQGVKPLLEYLEKCIADVRNPKASKSLRELFAMQEMRSINADIRSLVNEGFIHPKLVKLRELLLQQFRDNPESRVLVFASFRDSIISIIDYIEEHESIKAARFVGQQNRKKGRKVLKGMTQKDQIARLEQFRSGDINTLVATSVAEEGLDIAECDLVIFYDVVPSEIRTIQRRGRTGRKSSGKIYILITKGTREEGYYWAARRREKKMKKTLKNLRNNADAIAPDSGASKKDKSSSPNLLDFMEESGRKSDKNNRDSVSDDKVAFKKAEEDHRVSGDVKVDKDEIYITAEEYGATSEGYSVVADNRETQGAVVRNLALLGSDIVLKNLPVADYIVSDRMGIERKEAVDFSDSLKDGRLFDELHTLRSNFRIPVLFLEGDPVTATGISKNAILGAISAIISNMQITVLKTDSAEETADFIYALAKKEQENRTPKARIFKKKTSSLHEVQEQIVAGVPGVNLYRAQELLSHFSTIKELFNAPQERLEEVEGVGPKTAEKIKKIVEFNYNEKIDRENDLQD